MGSVTRIFKDNKVILKTRLSKGVDEFGKRIRPRITYEVSINDYPTEEDQDRAFYDYLVSIGEEPNFKIKEDENEIILQKKNELSDNEIDKSFNKVNEDATKNKEIKGKVFSTRQITYIPLDELILIKNNPSDPTSEFIERLAKAIYEDGLNNPIRVARYNGKNYIETGNKRYKAYQLLREMYGDDYSKIECYVVDYEIKDFDEFDTMFTLKLMRDNINTYERSLKDKVREVSLYHSIFPSLKELKIASGRENEWIAKEMGISDKSVKDYLKIDKVDIIMKMFLNDEIETIMTALRLVDYYQKYGKDDFYIMLGSVKRRKDSGKNEKIVVNYFDIDNAFWNKEREEKKKIEKEIMLNKKEEKEKEERKENQENEYVVPTFENLKDIPYISLMSKKVSNLKLSLELDFQRILVSFQIYNEIDENEYSLCFRFLHEDMEILLFKKPEETEMSYWNNEYVGKRNIVFKFKCNILFDDYNGILFFEEMITFLKEERICLNINDKENFIENWIKILK